MPKLSVVDPDTPPPPPRKAVPIKVAVDASERELLVAMRAKAAAEIDSGVPAHTLAPLMRQLRELDREIRAIDARAEQEGQRAAEVADEAFDYEAI